MGVTMEMYNAVMAIPAGKELDELIAEKVLGWKRMPHWWTPPGRATDGGFANPPAFSTDITAAWAVVEHYPEYISLHKRAYPNMLPYEVNIRAGAGFPHNLFIAEGETMPLAVCRTALLAERVPSSLLPDVRHTKEGEGEGAIAP